MIYPRVVLGAVVAFLFLLVCGLPRRIAQGRGGRFARGAPVAFHRLFCTVIGVRVTVHGRPLAAARRLIVANHVSWLDIPVLGSIEPLTFVAKKEVGAPALGGRLARLQGVIFVDRGRPRCIPGVNVEMAQVMARGEPVVLFAEATTGDGNRLLPFRSSHFEAIRQAAASAEGVAASAEDVAAAVQPVFLDYSRLAGLRVARSQRPIFAWYGDTGFLDHLWRFLRAGGVSCDVYFGPLIPVSADSGRKTIARATEIGVRVLAGRARGLTSPIPASLGSS